MGTCFGPEGVMKVAIRLAISLLALALLVACGGDEGAADGTSPTSPTATEEAGGLSVADHFEAALGELDDGDQALTALEDGDASGARVHLEAALSASQ
jgi:hypothetical protein